MINLHIHTNLSDGKYSPMEIIKIANERGLKVIALTDHNTMVSDEEFEELKLAFKGERLLRGCEVSVGDVAYGTTEEKEFHYVCLFPDDTVDLSGFRRLVARNVNPDTRPRITAIMKRLREEEGIDLGTYEEMVEIYGDRIRLPHLAEQMYLQGYTNSVAEGLDIYIGERGEKRCYVPKNQKFISLYELLPVLWEAKGIPILAHLKAYQLTAEQEEHLLYYFRCVAGSVAAMETDYARYDWKTRLGLHILAKQVDLGTSAGTDFHGFVDTDVFDGEFDERIYEELMERWDSYYNEW